MGHSENEALLEKLLDGETTDIVPQSRVEELLLSLVNGEEVNKIPRSRIEAYLQALIVKGGSGNLSAEIVWENASPANGFDPQTIELDLSDVDYVCLNYHTSNSLATMKCIDFIPVGKGVLMDALQTTGGTNTRKAVVSTTGITFENGSTNGNPNNVVIIPYQIIVIRLK